MVACGAICALMSGSGSTVFGIFKDRDNVEGPGAVCSIVNGDRGLSKALHSSPYQFVS